MNPIPESAQTLLDRIVESFRGILSENSVGIYLHGSLAMGGYNPAASDIDFLVVVRDPLDVPTKQAIVSHTLEFVPDAPPKGLEFSIVLLEITQHFVSPTPFEFHYSPFWHDALRSGTVDLMIPRTDPDLAAHFTITRARGICLYGFPIEQVFGEVPEADYWASILGDAEFILEHYAVEDYVFEDSLFDPVYDILNLCRVIAYKRDKLITSKIEGAAWALKTLEESFRPLITNALAAYQSDPLMFHWYDNELKRFGEYARSQLFG